MCRADCRQRVFLQHIWTAGSCRSLHFVHALIVLSGRADSSSGGRHSVTWSRRSRSLLRRPSGFSAMQFPSMCPSTAPAPSTMRSCSRHAGTWSPARRPSSCLCGGGPRTVASAMLQKATCPRTRGHFLPYFSCRWASPASHRSFHHWQRLIRCQHSRASPSRWLLQWLSRWGTVLPCKRCGQGETCKSCGQGETVLALGLQLASSSGASLVSTTKSATGTCMRPPCASGA
mmetsp:Transcript_27177/g.78311  ORF Transcript_27177/g.78311 Transcript_27177/m.78311 type:complete len:231 (+) Transcript_27177:688-1380(+)